MISVTEKQIVAIMPTARLMGRAKSVVPYVNDAMSFLEITTVERQAAFLAHVAFESVELIGQRRVITPSDPYQTRGWLPLTGRDNYYRMRVLTGFDFMQYPYKIDNLEWAPWAAAYLWRREGGNKLADEWDVRGIIHKFTGKLPVKSDETDRRLSYFAAAAKALGVEKGVAQV